MTTLHTRSETSILRSPSTATLLGAVAAGAILVLAAAWPGGGDAPSVLSAATADTRAAPVPAAATPAWPQGTSVPDAAGVFAGQTSKPEEPVATF
jgi:hypothetical protein